MNRYVLRRKIIKKRKRKKKDLFNNNHGMPKDFLIEKGENFFFLYYKGKPRAKFYYPITIEMIRKYASAYARCIKEFKLKV